MSNKRKVILKGPLLTQSGYGEQARYALRSLRTREDLYDIYIMPITWGVTSWSREHDEERKWIDERIEATIAYVQQGGQFDMSLQVTIPLEFEPMAPINVGYTAGIETSKMAPEWIEKINSMDRVMTISSHSQRVMENSEYRAARQTNGVQGEEFVHKVGQGIIKYINYPVKTFNELPNIQLDLETSFNFICTNQWSTRKNIHSTIKWFIEEFKDDKNVGLVVKTNVSKNCLLDRRVAQARVKEIVDSFDDVKCKIYLLHGDMTDKEMHALYKHEKIHCFVTTTYGEGFGLTMFEAAYSGLPVIATAWSGQLDFLVDENGKNKFYPISFDMRQVPEDSVWQGVITADSMWAVPREHSAKKMMREVYENYENRILVDGITERFASEKMHAEFVQIFDEAWTSWQHNNACPIEDVDEWLNELSDEFIINE